MRAHALFFSFVVRQIRRRCSGVRVVPLHERRDRARDGRRTLSSYDQAPPSGSFMTANASIGSMNRTRSFAFLTP
jgi:hypothetical protein